MVPSCTCCVSISFSFKAAATSEISTLSLHDALPIVHVQQLREWFAEKDYKNGMFYFRRRAFDSAIIYFKDVIANYQGTARVVDALMRLVDSYRTIGYSDELKETCGTLRK